MTEIVVKSPSLKQRQLDTFEFVAKITLGPCASDDVIDVPGISVVATATGFTLCCFEAETDLALDSNRDGLVSFISHGVVSALPANADYASSNPFYPGDITILTGTISGTAGSRVVTFDMNLGDAAVALDLTSDSITNAHVKFYIPIRPKDFT